MLMMRRSSRACCWNVVRVTAMPPVLSTARPAPGPASTPHRTAATGHGRSLHELSPTVPPAVPDAPPGRVARRLPPALSTGAPEAAAKPTPPAGSPPASPTPPAPEPTTGAGPPVASCATASNRFSIPRASMMPLRMAFLACQSSMRTMRATTTQTDARTAARLALPATSFTTSISATAHHPPHEPQRARRTDLRRLTRQRLHQRADHHPRERQPDDLLLAGVLRAEAQQPLPVGGAVHHQVPRDLRLRDWGWHAVVTHDCSAFT